MVRLPGVLFCEGFFLELYLVVLLGGPLVYGELHELMLNLVVLLGGVLVYGEFKELLLLCC